MNHELKCWLEQVKAKWISDERYIARKYKKSTGKDLDLVNPQTFTAKIQWLKLYWRPAILTQCADKVEVRKFVAERTNAELIKKTYGVYDRVEDIDLDELPSAFVLKVNRGCKLNIFCPDKSKLDWEGSKKLLRRYMTTNQYYPTREWAYKNIVPRILCEEHLTPGGEDIGEFNFYCFNGTPRIVEVIHGSGGACGVNMFDLELNLLERKYSTPPLSFAPQKDEAFEAMREYAAALCQGFPFVRVDLFQVGGRVLFGELSFYPLGGMLAFRPTGFDGFLGSFLELPAPVAEGE